MLWASSPTTHRFRWSATSRSTTSPWRRLVSWYSSTSTCWNRSREHPAHRLPLGQQDLPVEEQVVEVHGVELVLPLGVAARHAQDLVGERQRTAGAGRPRTSASGVWVFTAMEHEVDEHVGLGEAPGPDREPAVGDGRGHHVAGVLAVEDGVARRVAQLAARARGGARGRRGGRCRPGDAPRVDPAHLLHPPEHLPGRLVGEGEEQERLGREPRRATRRATRQVRVRVFPEPAPAMTRMGPPPASTTAICWSLRRPW